MKRHLFFTLPLVAAISLLPGLGQPVAAQEAPGATLDVMTFNVWHGLRSGESKKRFPGEDPDRAAKRFAWQIQKIQRLDPDVLLLQEVNPNQPQSQRYAEALGYDEIHKVTSCGLHLGGIYKIPENMNEGIAILAKPELGLRHVGNKRLSGDAMCSATWGFQTKESRYALFGEITVGGQKILLTTTHLASPAFTPVNFDQQLAKMVEAGDLTTEQRDEILASRNKKLARNTTESQRLLREIDRHRSRISSDGAQAPVILGGDFNAESDRPGITKIKEAGFAEAASGPGFLTWNPVINAENYEIGTRRHYSLPTFDKPELEEMLDQRHETPRQIDHLFVTDGIRAESAEMVMNEAQNGIYPSDHFGLLATLRLP